ncbi:hypothetical protein KR093_010796 [Drosophila rubida]|uniref:Uncharacterized protein n=1 Tax=Drosophila rubida TaxID=30044 RepID=A0AAD4KBR8_9MUSC|nr:hypothetical protein KR093_010796 [Drosophila rubida]
MTTLGGSSPNLDEAAANIAAKAAQEATAANDAQSNAAAFASKQVKMQLAEKAIQASKSVQAVLACKRALVEKLHTELRSAEALSTHLRTCLQHIEGHVQKVESGIKSSAAHLKRLSDVQEMLKHSFFADVTALGELAQADFNEKRQMLVAAKERSDRLQSQLDCVRRDHEQVKLAAYQAARAAVEARQKATSTADRSCHQMLLRRRRGNKIKQQTLSN